MSLPITGVTVGDSFAPGNNPFVLNLGLGFIPIGIEPPAVGGVRRVADASIFVPDFNHVDASLDTPLLNIPLEFGTPGSLYFFIPSSIDPSLEHLFGLPVIDQEFGIQPPGIPPPLTSHGIATRVVFGAEFGGFTDFLFVDPYTSPSTLNVPFYFGPGLVIAGVTLGDQSIWLDPIEEIEVPFAVLDITLGDTFGSGQLHRISDQPPVVFLFTGAYEPQVGSSIDLPFGGLLTQWVLYAGISPEHTDDNLSNGLIVLENSAFALAVEGFDSSDVQRGATRFYYSLDGEAGLLEFVFVQSYNPGSGVGQFPPSLNVPFYFAFEQVLGPGGINSLEFGPTQVKIDADIEFASVGDTGSFGQTVVKPEARFLYSSGHDSLVLGFDHEIFNLDRTLDFFGMELDSLQFGSETAPDLELFVSHYARYVDLWVASSGIQDPLFGTQWVSNYERYLEPDGWTSWTLPFLQIGQHDVDFKTKYLYPNSAPFEGVVSDSLTVDRGEQYLLGIGGIYDFGIGLLSELYNLTREIGPGVTLGEQTLWMIHNVYNSDQYIEEPFWDIYTSIEWPKFGPGDVRNRNRSISPPGMVLADYFLYGTPYVFNNARLVAPEGFLLDPNIEPRWNSDLFVSHYIRELDTLGFDSFRPTGFPFGTLVYNSSFQFLIEGFDSLGLSDTNRVFDPTQFLIGVGKIDGSIFGTDWFSFSPRYVDLTHPFSIYGIFDETFGDNTGDLRVSNYTYYVYADSVGDSYSQSYPWIREIFKIIGPSPVLPSSDPSTGLQIHNDTLQFFPTGIYSLEIPTLIWISHSPRDIVLDFRHSISLLPRLFGDTFISNRDRTIYDIGDIHSLKIDPFTLVYIQAPSGPYTFYLRLDDAGGFGIGPLINRWGSAEIRKHPYDVGGIDSLLMGVPSVVALQILPLWDWPSSQFSFGTPLFGDPLNLISDVSVGASQVAYGDVAVSPHTIWARTDTPQQAQDNHSGNVFHVIDALLSDRTQLPKEEPQWGTANVFLPGVARTLTVFHDIFSTATGVSTGFHIPYWGAVDIVLFDREIEVPSLPSSLFGFPEFPTNKVLFVQPFSDIGLGDVELFQEHVPYTQTITVVGLDSSDFGDTNIELFNRALPVTGLDATLFGNNNPMVYHYPRGFTDAGGTDMTIWGTTWVSHHTRSYDLEGFDSFTTDFDPMLFAQRARVRHGTTPFPLAPINDLSFGDVGIRNESLRVTVYQIPPPRCIGEDVYVQH